MNASRGIRNNNPLNIRRSTDRWVGVSDEQTDKSFVQFKNMAYGYRAVWKILQSYYDHFCIQSKPFTVRNIISRWAPPSENDTEMYIRQVLRISGIGGKENLLPPNNASCYCRLRNLITAMTCVECGIPSAKVDTEAICKGYRLAFPENDKELDKCLQAEDEYWGW